MRYSPPKRSVNPSGPAKNGHFFQEDPSEKRQGNVSDPSGRERIGRKGSRFHGLHLKRLIEDEDEEEPKFDGAEDAVLKMIGVSAAYIFCAEKGNGALALAAVKSVWDSAANDLVGEDSAKGYLESDLKEAFRRYIPKSALKALVEEQREQQEQRAASMEKEDLGEESRAEQEGHNR